MGEKKLLWSLKGSTFIEQKKLRKFISLSIFLETGSHFKALKYLEYQGLCISYGIGSP